MCATRQVDTRPSQERETYLRAAADVLGRVAAAARPGGDLADVLSGLAELALEATGGDRVSFFLLDEEGTKVQLWGVRGAPNSQLWELGKSMPSIALDQVPALADALTSGMAVGIEDAKLSPLVPPAWSEAFNLTSLVLAPLVIGAEALGALVIDYRLPRSLDDDLVKVAATLGRVSALAVANAMLTTELAEQANRLETLVDATRALRSPRSVLEVAEDVTDLIVRVLDARTLAVYILEPGGARFRVLSQRGTAMAPFGDVSELPSRAVAEVRAAWRVDPQRAVVLRDARQWASGVEDGTHSLLVLPLTRIGGDLFGFIVVGSPHTDTPASTSSLAGALAAHVAFALERAQLDERIALAAEFACTLLSLDGFAGGEGDATLAALREIVPPAIGFEVTGLRIATPYRSRRRTGTEDRVERGLWAAWRARRTRPDVREEDGVAYAPIWADGRLLGIVRATCVHGRMARHERDLLEALAAAISERLAKEELRERADHRSRELAMAEERSRVADELHATVGRLLENIEQGAEAMRAQASDPETAKNAERIAWLAWAGRTGLKETADSLGAITYDPKGLPATLEGIIDSLSAKLDIAADLEVRGCVRRLPLAIEQAIVRTTHEALSRVESRGRASSVAVRLEYAADAVTLIVRDDGVSLGHREGDSVGPSAHFGLRMIARRISELGGTFTIERPPPRGLMLTARVPA